MRLLNDPPVQTEGLPPEEEAVRIQARLDSLKTEIEVLTAQRDEAIKAALKRGVRNYGGFRFGMKAPSATISEKKMAETHPAEFDGYCAWYPTSREIKLTKTDLAKYLKLSGHTNPDQVINDCLEIGTGDGTPTLTKVKEAGA